MCAVFFLIAPMKDCKKKKKKKKSMVKYIIQEIVIIHESCVINGQPRC